MAEIFNLSALCRCCHTDGRFKSLNLCYSYKEQMEVYANMLHETFGLILNQPSIEASYSICDTCIEKLRNALQFKKQVQECEMKFADYCKNEMALQQEIKIEHELCDKIKSEMDIKVEECNDDYEYSNAEYADNKYLSKNDNTKEKKINIEYEQNFCLEKQKSATPSTELLTECLKKERTVKTHSKIQPNKCSQKQKSDLSIAQIKRRNCTEKKKLDIPGNPKSESRITDDSDSGAVNACQNCKRTFKTEKNLRCHLQTKHSIFTCIICRESYSSKEALEMHKPIHTNKHECDICGKVFTHRWRLTFHKNQHTREKIFTCDMCNKDFLYKSTLKKHIDFHLGRNKRIMCDLCGHTFNDITNLNTHIRAVHEKLKLFKCEHCPKIYSTRKTLKIHTRVHTGERPYECQLCGEAFVCTTALRYHTERHHAHHTNLEYVCNICGKHCFTRSRLASHTRTHIGVKKAYKCHRCEREFSGGFALKRHIERHEGTAKLFPCEICQKNFAGKATMMRHMKNIHDPNKQFVTKTKCNLCKKPVRDMEKHMKTHTGRLLKCEHCLKSYSETSALNRHVREIHCGITHDCNLCDKKYIKAKSLRTHKLKKHKTHIQLKVEQEDARKIENENNSPFKSV